MSVCVPACLCVSVCFIVCVFLCVSASVSVCVCFGEGTCSVIPSGPVCVCKLDSTLHSSNQLSGVGFCVKRPETYSLGDLIPAFSSEQKPA